MISSGKSRYISRFNRLLTSLALVLLLGAKSPVWAQEAPSRFWIFLEDKSALQLDTAGAQDESRIAARAHLRRARRGTGDEAWLDRPVSAENLDTLRGLGIEPVVVSRWLNAVSAVLSDAQLDRVERLPFVKEVREVARLNSSRASHPIQESSAALQSDLPVGFLDPSVFRTAQPYLDVLRGGSNQSRPTLDYGNSYQQLALINAIEPLENGINGSGVTLGFLDAPFADFAHPALTHLTASGRLLEVRDFVERPQGNQSHGLSVVSVAAGFALGQLIGPAFGAEILAAVTEYAPTETNLEEDYFVAGLEWLESRGVDVVNVSLGYTRFDPGQRSYTPDDLDGDTGVTTRAADLAASLGVVMVVSAGNEGCSSPDICWYYISTPADGDSVIAVGAVRSDSTRASFSSFGPTADGRIKPDVSAPGVGVFAAVPGTYTYVAGTSFASPLVAGVVAQMLQANPDLRPADVLQILRDTAGRSDDPDNSVGWGVINAAAAVREAMHMGTDPGQPAPPVEIVAYPNPATDHVVINISARGRSFAQIEVFDLLGRRVLPVTTHVLQATGGTVRLPTTDFPSGLYVYRVQLGDESKMGRFLVIQP